MTVTDARIVQGAWDAGRGAWTRADAILARSGGTVEFEVSEAEPGASDRLESGPTASHSIWRVTLDLEPVGPSVDQGALRGGHPSSTVCGGCYRPMVAMEGKAGPERELSRLKAQVGRPAPAIAQDDVKTSPMQLS